MRPGAPTEGGWDVTQSQYQVDRRRRPGAGVGRLRQHQRPDGPNIAYECQLQARDAANQPPFPDKIRDGKHGQAFEQGVRDAHMTQACQRDTESHAEIRFGNKPGT